MNELAVSAQNNLPASFEDLTKFVLIGREKLNAVRAEIRAIKKVGLAEAVRRQKLNEAQAISEAVLDAEVRIGELMQAIPKATKGIGGNRYQSAPVREIDSGVDFSKSEPEAIEAADDEVGHIEIEEIQETDNSRTSQTEADVEDNSDKPKTKSEVIKETGFTQKQVERFQQLAAHPEAVAQAKAEAKANDDIVSRSLVLNMIKEQKRAEQKEQRERQVAEQINKPRSSAYVDIFNTSKKYRVIYADPPWEYNDKQDTEKLGGAVKHYPTMPLNEICALPVPTEDNAVLFLWTTSPMLEDAFKVINSWGFKYKSSFIWDKIDHAMGHYNSVRHEFLLIAVRGSCTPDKKKLFDSVVSIKRTEHSRKPKEFRDMIDELYPVGNRLEMFARGAQEGWDVWGNMA